MRPLPPERIGKCALDTLPSTTQSPLPSITDSNLHTADLRDEFSPEPRRFQYQIHVLLRGVYDDNINISQNHVSDYYFTFEPTLTVGFGDINGQDNNFFRFDYAPGIFLFLDHSEDDAVQHVIRLRGQHPFSRLTVGMSEQIAILDGTDVRNVAEQTAPGSQPNLDVAGRAKFQTYTTSLTAAYDLSGKTFLSTGIDSLVTNYSTAGLFSSGDVLANLFLNYRYSDKLVVGAGGSAGYDFVQDPNPDQTFEQANVRFSYQASGKLSLNATGGVEFREFENDSARLNRRGKT